MVVVAVASEEDLEGGSLELGWVRIVLQVN